MVTNQQLVAAALECLHPLRREDGAKFENVAAAVASSSGGTYQGVNLFTPAGAAGICAERTAHGAMSTAGEYEPAKIVALWRPREGGDVRIVSPCAWCRELVNQMQRPGTDTLFVLGTENEVPLSLLLPQNERPGPPIKL